MKRREAQADGALRCLIGPVRAGRWESSFDDERWRDASDGSRYAIFQLGDGDDAPVVAAQEVPAGYRFAAHRHDCNYFTYVVSGSLRVGRKWYRAGDIRVQARGTVHGPEFAGSDGCRTLNVFAQRRGMVPWLLEDATPTLSTTVPDVLLTEAGLEGAS